MKTILKFPVYVLIESENIDRSLVSKEANRTLLPELITFIRESAEYKNSVRKEFEKSIGSKVTIKWITEVDLVQNTVDKESVDKL